MSLCCVMISRPIRDNNLTNILGVALNGAAKHVVFAHRRNKFEILLVMLMAFFLAHQPTAQRLEHSSEAAGQNTYNTNVAGAFMDLSRYM
jgi:hypothetical protein